MAAIHRVPDSFIDSTLSLVSGLAEASHVVFFWLDGRLAPTCCRTNLADRDYDRFLRGIDPRGPISPCQLIKTGRTVEWLDASRSDDGHYGEYLRSHRFAEEIDLVLRCGDDVLAGIAAFRDINEAGSPRGRGRLSSIAPVLEKSVPYIEYNLSRYFGGNRAMVRSDLSRLYGLTVRETDVAELIGAGCTNADISSALGLGLATVKTHVLNLFRKMGVENRSSIVALLPR